MTSFNKRRKSKNRAKKTDASDRFYLGSKSKDSNYGMYNSSMRMTKNKSITNELD